MKTKKTEKGKPAKRLKARGPDRTAPLWRAIYDWGVNKVYLDPKSARIIADASTR